MSAKSGQSLAQNKLLLLYMLKQSSFELSELQIMRIMNDLGFMGYFDLMERLLELESDQHIYSNVTPQATLYGITKEGANIVDVLMDELRLSSRKLIDTYLAEHKDELAKESQLIGEFIKIGDNEYRVTLKVLEKTLTVFEINIVVYSRAEAQLMIDKWRDNAVSIYKDLILRLS